MWVIKVFSTRFQLQEGLMTDVKVEQNVRGQAGGLESAACFQTQPICEGRLVLCSAGVSKNGGGGFHVHMSMC